MTATRSQRRLDLAVLVLVLIAGVTAIILAIREPGGETSAHTPLEGVESKALESERTKGRPGANQLALGETAEMTEDDLSAEVAVVRVVDPLLAAEDQGNTRLIGLIVSFDNTGATEYSSYGSSDVQLIGDAGKLAENASVTGGGREGCESVAGPFSVPPGETAEICAAFSLPVDEEPVAARYALDLGFGEPREWSLTQRRGR